MTYLISRLCNEALPIKSSYLLIKAKTNSTIFYTFYEVQKLTSALSQTSFLIWLHGGPDCSMTENFIELDPYHIIDSQDKEHLTHQSNLDSWDFILFMQLGIIF